MSSEYVQTSLHVPGISSFRSFVKCLFWSLSPSELIQVSVPERSGVCVVCSCVRFGVCKCAPAWVCMHVCTLIAINVLKNTRSLPLSHHLYLSVYQSIYTTLKQAYIQTHICMHACTHTHTHARTQTDEHLHVDTYTSPISLPQSPSSSSSSSF